MDGQPRASSREHSSPGRARPLLTGRWACLTVDVEEYFHAEVHARCVSRTQWPQMERRAAPFVERLAGLLQRHESKVTFFVLGWMVEGLAPLLRHLATQGHEIACHGDAHDHLLRMTPKTLREDLHRARGRIEGTLGVRPRGYRAPTFSITRATAWALDVVIEAGFEYDASVFPIHHDRYGVPDAPVLPFWITAPSGARILEFPPLTLGWGFLRVPVGGGGYLRLLPERVLRRCIARRVRRGQPAMVYLHPWELDPDQPRLRVGRLARWRHRVNLRTTEAKLERLLAEFRFDTAWNVLARVTSGAELPVFDLGVDGGSS
jgi:polysaccharide deacetylase family protein (PEP-CTERM system associated)